MFTTDINPDDEFYKANVQWIEYAIKSNTVADLLDLKRNYDWKFLDCAGNKNFEWSDNVYKVIDEKIQYLKDKENMENKKEEEEDIQEMISRSWENVSKIQNPEELKDIYSEVEKLISSNDNEIHDLTKISLQLEDLSEFILNRQSFLEREKKEEQQKVKALQKKVFKVVYVEDKLVGEKGWEFIVETPVTYVATGEVAYYDKEYKCGLFASMEEAMKKGMECYKDYLEDQL